MCGIFFSLSSSHPVLPTDDACSLLCGRGPDDFQVHTIQYSTSSPVYLTFVSTVLSLRGDYVQSQPLVDPESQSVLCWNGEAWKVAGERVEDNDTEHIFKLFVQAVKPSSAQEDITNSRNAVHSLADVISNISGPFSFVFYDGFNSKLFFSRDCLGRRSLLQGFDKTGSLKICSLCDGTPSTQFEEVDTNGVHAIDLSTGNGSSTAYNIDTLSWDDESRASHLRTPIPPMNKSPPQGDPPPLTIESTPVKDLELRLRSSLELRICNVPQPPNCTKNSAKAAVLFSGGLDCTLLARLSHEILSTDETIDLLNVAFENPRVVAAAANNDKATPSAYESCPDRITGRAAFAELNKICPDRNWRFVAVDIPYTETVAHREKVKRLMRPHNTEMDLSIACALYFASRGQGTAFESRGSGDTAAYISSARVLLSGLGADELFAGYARHGVAYSRNGFSGLIDEINLDVSRLGKRNLGRDDRIISNWGREARYPYLDEEFVSWVLQAPVWEKCGFGIPSDGDEPSLDPEKKALRLIALRLGLEKVAREKKRAIQFGSRTAKMERGRTRGTDSLG